MPAQAPARSKTRAEFRTPSAASREQPRTTQHLFPAAQRDTLEMIERPRGGLSFVLVDGQHTGRGAKAISNLVARKAISLLGEGVRDGAAARAAHDYLFTQYEGKVQASLNIVSIDLVSKTMLFTQNTPLPILIIRPDGVAELAKPSTKANRASRVTFQHRVFITAPVDGCVLNVPCTRVVG